MNDMVKFNSMSAEVKSIIMKAVADGKEHDRKELISIIDRNMKGEVSPGVIAGCFKMLTAKNEVMAVRRGVYKIGMPAGRGDLRQQVESIMLRVGRELDKVCTVNALQLDDDDIEFLKKVKIISDSLEADIWTLIDGKEEAKQEEASQCDNVTDITGFKEDLFIGEKIEVNMEEAVETEQCDKSKANEEIVGTMNKEVKPGIKQNAVVKNMTIDKKEETKASIKKAVTKQLAQVIK